MVKHCDHLDDGRSYRDKVHLGLLCSSFLLCGPKRPRGLAALLPSLSSIETTLTRFLSRRPRSWADKAYTPRYTSTLWPPRPPSPPSSKRRRCNYVSLCFPIRGQYKTHIPAHAQHSLALDLINLDFTDHKNYSFLGSG